MLFKRNFLLNKTEVLESLDKYIEHWQYPDKELCSEEKRKVVINLSLKFKDLVEKTRFPEIKEDWWYYDYNITNDGMELELRYCEEIEFDDNDEVSETTSSEGFKLVLLKCDYITVDDYARQYSVTTTTVRQWIRRGKIRSARKLGRDWMIPEIADKPRRGYESVTYLWEYPLISLEKEFTFLIGCSGIYIYQDDCNKNVYYGVLQSQHINDNSIVKFSKSELEKLELALISSSQVSVQEVFSGLMYIPSKNY